MQKNQLILILILSLVSANTLFGQKSGIKLSSLMCEYLENPLGIDVTIPRFSFRCI